MKIQFALSFFALIIVTTFTYSQDKNYTAADSEIKAVVYEDFTITLSSNHTTGYSWSLGMESSSSEVVFTGMEYKVPGDANIGEGGEEIWHFKAVEPGTVRLMFYYIRPWEDTKPVNEKTFSVNVK